MKQTVRVIRGNGLPRTGHSPNKFLEKKSSLDIPKIDREFRILEEKLITDRHDAARTKGEAKLANSRKLVTRVTNAVKKGFTALTSGTSARQKGFYLPQDQIPSTPPSVSPLEETEFIELGISPSNSPHKGGYNSQKYKKATVLAKKPKKATVLAKKPKKPTVLAKKPKKPTVLAKKPKKPTVLAKKPKKVKSKK
jgi:hypothetical protein